MRFFFLLYFLYQFVFAFAQSSGSSDVVYLNDGSVLRGEITEYRPGGAVKLTIPNGNTVDIPASMVARVEIGMIPEEKNQKPMRSGEKNMVSDGTRFYLMGSLLMPRNNNFIHSDVPGISIHAGAIHRPVPWYGLGIMTGVDVYEPGMGRATIPVYATGIINLADETNSPFVRGGLGWSFPVTSSQSETFDNKGGIFAQIGAGMEFFSRGRTALHFELAYLYQYSEFKYPGGWWPVGIIEENINYRRLKLNIGFSF